MTPWLTDPEYADGGEAALSEMNAHIMRQLERFGDMLDGAEFVACNPVADFLDALRARKSGLLPLLTMIDDIEVIGDV